MSQRKDAFYFPHDSNAHMDERVLELRAEFGWEGYGIYWALVERMRDASDYRIGHRSRRALALGLAIDAELLDRLVEFCIEIGLFVAEEECFGSPALDRRMVEVDSRRKKRQAAGAKGGKAKKADETKPEEASPEQPAGEEDEEDKQCLSNAQALLKHCEAGKERKGKKKKEKEEEGESECGAREAAGNEGDSPDDPDPPPGGEVNPYNPHHQPPTEEVIRAAAEAAGVPPEEAVAIADHFESRGWIDRNGTPIRHWLKAITSAYKSNHRRGDSNGNAHRGSSEKAGARPATDYQRRRDFASTPFDPADYEHLAESLRGIKYGDSDGSEDH